MLGALLQERSGRESLQRRGRSDSCEEGGREGAGPEEPRATALMGRGQPGAAGLSANVRVNPERRQLVPSGHHTPQGAGLSYRFHGCHSHPTARPDLHGK